MKYPEIHAFPEKPCSVFLNVPFKVSCQEHVYRAAFHATST